jgi:hypothetical protein
MPDVVLILKIFHDSDVFLVHVVSAKGGMSLADKLSPVVIETLATVTYSTSCSSSMKRCERLERFKLLELS